MNNFAETVRNSADIVQVVSEYVTLKGAGTALKALCPFHSEKTPSFSVHREKQVFHCFGCGAGGDVFEFVKRIENVSFPEALRIVDTFTPTLGLLDIGLPVMDGYELARRLRNIPSLSGMRLVAVTGYGERAAVERSRDAGFEGHLVKPVEVDLLDTVARDTTRSWNQTGLASSGHHVHHRRDEGRLDDRGLEATPSTRALGSNDRG